MRGVQNAQMQGPGTAQPQAPEVGWSGWGAVMEGDTSYNGLTKV